MFSSLGQPSDPNDRTLRQAEEDAQRDYARLLYQHSPSWTINVFTGAVRWTCSCDSPGPRTSSAMDLHILKEVREARGPVKSK